MAVSGPTFRNTMVGFCPRVEEKILLPCTPPFLVVASQDPSSSLMGGCGLSDVEDVCKSTCLKFGGKNVTKLGIR